MRNYCQHFPEKTAMVQTGSSISRHQGVSGVLNSRCLWMIRCCTCCRRIISVEPVAFLYVFTTYMYLATFVLYAFTTKAVDELTVNTTINETCITSRLLNAYGRDGNKSTNVVQSEVAVLNLYVGIASQIPGIISALVLGPFSDRYGRKIAMGVVVVGLGLQSILAYFIMNFKLNLLFFVLSSGLRALTGGLAGLLTTSYSYIADISSKKWLTLRLGILEAVIFIASSLGLGFSGFLIQISGCKFTIVSWLMLAASIAVIVHLILLLPESLNRRQTIQRRLLLTTGPKSLFVGVKIFFDRSRGVGLWKLWLSIAILSITVLNQIGTLTTVTLFALHEPLNWKPALIGAYLAASEFIRGLSLVLLLPFMVACSLRDPLIALLGVFITCGTYVGMGFVRYSWQMFLVASFQGMDAIITPAVKAIMSKLVPAQEQGALFSFISAVQVLSGAAAFVLYSLVYKATLRMGWNPACPFWLMAILYTITIPLLITLLMFTKSTSRRKLFVNSESVTTSPPPSPSLTQSTTPIPTSPTQHLAPHTYHYHHQNSLSRDNNDIMGGSIEWALSRSQAQCYPPPRVLSPASIGRDTLERQSLLRHSRLTHYHSTSINQD